MATTLKQDAYHYLRRRLLDGTFSPGERLSPTAVAESLGTSHIPVREAITQLQSEGLVVQRPRRGVFVRETDRQELIATIELRSILERSAAELAARRISDAQLDELTSCFQELREAGQWLKKAERNQWLDGLARWMTIDMSFHMVLLRAAGNPQLLHVVENTHMMTRMFGFRTDHPDAWVDMAKYLTESFRVHQDVYRAVRRHDSTAAGDAMAVHMNKARKNILARFNWMQQQREKSTDSAESGDFPESMRTTLSNIQRQQVEDAEKSTSSTARTKKQRKKEKS